MLTRRLGKKSAALRIPANDDSLANPAVTDEGLLDDLIDLFRVTSGFAVEARGQPRVSHFHCELALFDGKTSA